MLETHQGTQQAKGRGTPCSKAPWPMLKPASALRMKGATPQSPAVRAENLEVTERGKTLPHVFMHAVGMHRLAFNLLGLS